MPDSELAKHGGWNEAGRELFWTTKPAKLESIVQLIFGYEGVQANRS
jgi:hypothetical protein